MRVLCSPAVLSCFFRDLQFVYGRRLLANAFVLGAFVSLIFGQSKHAVAMILRACRFTDSRRYHGLVRKHLDLIRDYSPELLPEPVGIEVLDQRCVVLAEPRFKNGIISRKGVLLVSFTETSGQLFASVDWRDLYKLFHLVLEPSWAGYADPCLLCWLNYPEPVIIQTSEKYDRKLLQSLHTNLVAVPYGAGDWIDPNRFRPVDALEGVGYDAICVSNYGWWKRNHAYIRAVGKAVREIADYRAVLVLAGLGKTPRQVRRLKSLIRAYRVGKSVEIIDGLGQQELNRMLSCSGVLVFPSWKEGSSRIIYEAMCTDTPVVMLSRNVGVNKDYVNWRTGVIVEESDLGQALIRFHREGFQSSPRQWFLENLGPRHTTAKLAKDLGRVFPEEGWTSDELLVKANIPEPSILDEKRAPRPLSFWLKQV